ncbi:MAG: ribonuclease activity regulator RraA [Acetobacteraceae bacterium]
MVNNNDTGTRPLRSLDAHTRSMLSGVSTATITTVLLKCGLRNVSIRAAAPLDPDHPRIVGRAFTMRFIPGREDLATPESLASPASTRGAVEAMPPGSVAVVDAMGVKDVAILGDILCARMQQRGVAALVTDGALRDARGVRETGLPVWCAGVAAPPSVAGLTFVGWQQPVGCGGVAVFPDDVIVLDDDGAVVIPRALVDQVVERGPEAELMESWITQQVNAGRPLLGLYPPAPETLAEYEAWRGQQRGAR